MTAFLTRLQRLLLPALPLLLLSVGTCWMEAHVLDQTRRQIRKDAQYAAAELAEVIAGRLHTQLTELQFAAETLLGPESDPEHPDPKAVQALRHYKALHPSLYAFNIHSADGERILW